jgi:polyisoprenoid-binding protein YceI
MNVRTLALAAAVALPAAAAPVTYQIDTSHSVAAFSVKHLMVSNVRGELGAVTGTVVYDKDDVAKSTVEASIDVKAISTRDEKRDGHLKSPDFFDVAKFPTITFKSTKVEKAGDKLKVSGDLTMRGVTKPVTLDVEVPGAEVGMKAWGVLKTGTAATTVINRKEYGVSWSALADNGGAVVGDDVKVNLELELNRPDPAAKPAAPAAAPAKK